MHKLIAGVACLALTACASSGPPELAACLQSQQAMQTFNGIDGMKEMVGAIGRDGRIYCLVGRLALGSYNAEMANPSGVCQRAETSKTLMNCATLHRENIFGGRLTPFSPSGKPVPQISAERPVIVVNTERFRSAASMQEEQAFWRAMGFAAGVGMTR